MTQFFVKLPAGNTLTLDLDLDTTTVAAVKATVDARLQSFRRVLRSDLPFLGINLRHYDRILAVEKTLSSCSVRTGAMIYAEWPSKSGRKRDGKGWEKEPALKRGLRGDKESERKPKRAEWERKRTIQKAMREAAKHTRSQAAENTTQSAPMTDEDQAASLECVSGDQRGDEIEVEAEKDAQGLKEEVAEDEPDNEAEVDEEEERGEEEDQAEVPTEEVEQGDPFADEDDDKENREPEVIAPPIVGNQVEDYPAEEWLAFDESNTGLGLDLMESVLEV